MLPHVLITAMPPFDAEFTSSVYVGGSLAGFRNKYIFFTFPETMCFDLVFAIQVITINDHG